MVIRRYDHLDQPTFKFPSLPVPAPWHPPGGRAPSEPVGHTHHQAGVRRGGVSNQIANKLVSLPCRSSHTMHAQCNRLASRVSAVSASWCSSAVGVGTLPCRRWVLR